MADTPYPIPREQRQTAVLSGDGVNATYGPFAFKIFDIEDVAVYTKVQPATVFSLVAATVVKVDDLPQDFFTVTFPAPLATTTKYVVAGARLAERSAGIVKGTQLDQAALEKELSKLAVTEQELRRDVERAVKAEFGQQPVSLPLPVASNAIGWDDNGRLKNIPIPEGLDASALLAARDQVIMAAASFSPVSYYSYQVEVGETVIPIENGYDVGKVRTVSIEGLDALSSTEWTATDGENVVLATAISVDDLLPGQTTVTIIIGIGDTTAGLDAVDARYLRIADNRPVTTFGAIGDGVADDSVAVQAALTWWGSANDRTLQFDENKTFLLNSAVTIDCEDLSSPGSIIMHGFVKSAVNVAALFTFINIRGGRFRLKVFGGGQAADYSQADPAGINEAFRFVNIYGSSIEYVEGQEYAGLVLRITSAPAGSGGFSSQWLDIGKIYCNSSAKITDSEAVRLAGGVGQAFFIDSGSAAFGTIREVFVLWDKYGPVIEDTTDVTIHDLESLWRGNTGMELRGVISFWGGILKTGSEVVGWTSDLLKITDSATRSCQNINIDTIFAVGGFNGVSVTNVGSDPGQGLSITKLVSRLNTNRGLRMAGCSEFHVGAFLSYADYIALELAGTNDNGQINCQIAASKRQAIVISSDTNNVELTGSALNGNTSVTATTPLIDVNTANPILFNGFFASSGNVDYIYDIVAGNLTRIRDGRVVISGSSMIFNNDPNRARGTIGVVTENSAIATVLNGTSSLVVNHGLIKAPQWIGLTSRTIGSVDLYVNNITDTQFTINVSSAVGSDTPVLWDAKVDYHG